MAALDIHSTQSGCRRRAVRHRCALASAEAGLLVSAWRLWLASALAAFASAAVQPPASPVAQTLLVAGAGAAPTNADAGALASGSEGQDRALREEQLRVARQLYETFPRSDDAWSAAGLVCSEQGDSAAALGYWQKSVDLDPDAIQIFDRADAYHQIGHALLLREDYGQAVEMLRESIRLNPRRQETHYRLAHALYLQGQMEESLRVLDEARLESPPAHRLRGQVHQHLGKLREAKQCYAEALRLNPDFPEAHYGMAMTCARLGEEAKAQEHRKKFEALKSVGQAMGRQARTEFDPLAITRRSLARTHTEIGRVYLAFGQREMAEKLWVRAAEVDPANTPCRFQLVMLYQQSQRNQEALRFCQEMIRAEPKNGFHHLGLGNLYQRLSRKPEAEAAFKQAVELAPQRSEGYLSLAQFYLQNRTNLAGALTLAERAVALAPSAPNYFVLSQALTQNGDLPGARAAIERACQMDPQHPRYQEWRASLQRQK